MPALNGISVDPRVYEEVSGNDSIIALSPFLDQWRTSRQPKNFVSSTSCSDLVTIKIQSDEKRRSVSSDGQLSSGESEDETGGSLATTDSMGPRTPPPDSIEPPLRLSPCLSADGYLSPLGSPCSPPPLSESIRLSQIEEKLVQGLELGLDVADHAQ
ncbi:hypothetical protein BDN72DRAFT_851675 [Pluteus cervinus]|uniref:Uncharacterized protein n=1 Tax=Pluteus cervinus TaxID=181527 RepID=A0ACD2ZZI5_9AGAR|nr:hypothetical protein BDN72DRAFT_851675 [Pluteus cervinus]